MKFIKNYSANLKQLVSHIKKADAILIGAGAGLSTSAGYKYDGKRFYDNFADFIDKYGFHDMYSAGFHNFSSLEEYWAYWSRYIYINRYIYEDKLYSKLLSIVSDKEYFVLTTNVDHKFQQAGVDKEKIFYTQGDYGLFQCSKPCHDKTYDNKDVIIEMVEKQKNMRIPSDLIPYCPKCNSPFVPNLRADDTFVMDKGWYEAKDRYINFTEKYKNSYIVFLELGVGYNTPVIIKYPFWKMTYNNEKSIYASINLYEATIPKEIIKQSLCFNDDINKVITDIACRV